MSVDSVAAGPFSPLSPSPREEVSVVVARCLVELNSSIDRLAEVDLDGLTEARMRRTAQGLLALTSRVQARTMAITRLLDELGTAKKSGKTSTGDLLAGSFGRDGGAADRMVRSGNTIGKAPRTAKAMSDGHLGAAQADIIAAAIVGLPDETTAEQKQACEDTLIGDASKYSLKDLRSRAKRITDEFKTPEDVDAVENDDLEKAERRAWRSSEFSCWDNKDGTHSGKFRLPDVQAELLKSAIEKISAPRRNHLHDHPGSETEAAGETGSGDSVYDRDLDYRHRLGMGFAELAGHLPTDRLPGGGGLGASLMVRFDYDTLLAGIRPATMSDGTRVSAGQVRQMACNLGMVPLVFNGKSLPLDFGAEQRLFSRTQRRAMENRDGGCTFPACDRPPEWCEGHHAKQPFSVGGTSHLDEGVLLCPFHHRTVHQQGWTIRFHSTDGHPEYQSSPSGIWQRNHRWRP